MHPVERAIAALASVQDNIVGREQLLEAGVGRGSISHRMDAGSLHPVYQGVYLVGHAPPTAMGSARAAVLACRGTAVASHRTAAVLWRVLPAEAMHDPEVTVVARNPRSRPRLTIHRTAQLHATEIRQLRGLPLTSPARTICDIAATEPTNEVEEALQEARVRRLLTDVELKTVIERAPSRKGCALIHALLAEEGGGGYTRSKAERRMRSVLRSAGLPEPEVNVREHRYLLDFLWRRERIVVEVDGYGAHGHRGAFERDHRRDQVLAAAGLHVIRVTWRQLIDEPFAVVARLAQALALATVAAA